MKKNNNISIVLGSVLLTILTAVVVINILNKVDDKYGNKYDLNWNFSEGNNGVLNIEIVPIDKSKMELDGKFTVLVSNKNIKNNTNYKIVVDDKKIPDSISFDEIIKEGTLKPGESRMIEFKWKNKKNNNKKAIIVDVLVSGEQE